MKIYQHIILDSDTQLFLNSSLPKDMELIIADNNLPEDERYPLFSECEVAFGNVPAEWVVNSKELKWLQLESVGFDSYNGIGKDFSKRGVITNLHGFFGIPVSESALAGILSLKRGVGSLVSLKERKLWVGSSMRSSLTLLHGSRILIAGGGNIGHCFATLVEGFKPQITIFDRHSDRGDIDTVEQFDSSLTGADIVFSSLPDNRDTQRFFDARRFSLMKQGAIFVNVGRGALVDETALFDSLSKGRLAGAVLDVTLNEPLPENSPLWDSPNLVLTQHTGGGTTAELKGKVEMFLNNLALYANGKTLTRTVTFR